MPKVFIDGLLKGEFVDVIQLDILHDQQPDPGLRLGNDRLRRSFGATDLEDVDIEELLKDSDMKTNVSDRSRLLLLEIFSVPLVD